jgi:hypothetical protein
MMAGHELAFRQDALLAVNLARRKREACRTALRLHITDHECAAVAVSA